MKKLIIDYLICNKKVLLKMILFITFGIIFSIVFSINLKEESMEKITDLIDNSLETLKLSNNIDRVNLFSKSIKKNLILIIIIFIFGFSIFGLISSYILNFIKGFYIGFSSYILFYYFGFKKGCLVVITSIIVHNLIYILALLIISISSINLYKNLFIKKQNFKENILCHFIIMLISIMLSIISSLIEVYFSSNLLYFLREIL